MDKFTRKTSFEQWLSPLNQTLLEEQVKTHQLNYYTKKLYMVSFLKLLLYAQLHETKSLRALSDAAFSDDLQCATGLDFISFSQLGRRINTIPTEFFQTNFLDLVAQIHKKTDFEKRRKISTPLKFIDSSTLLLNLTNHTWAEFRKTKLGIKLHLCLVFMEKGFSYPDIGLLTNVIEHDRGQLEYLLTTKNACMCSTEATWIMSGLIG